MKKKILALVLVVSAILSTSTAVFAERPIKIKVGGELLKTDVAPVVIDGRVMLPVRAVFEAIDAKVDYIAEDQKVVATKKDTTATFVVDSNIMTVNGEEKEIDVPATVIDGRTMVPVRACAEAFELKVEWNGNTKTVKVRKPVSLVAEENDGSRYEYDHNGMMVKADYTDGVTVKWVYDENEALLYWESGGTILEEFTNDEYGKCISSTSMFGEECHYFYDENDNLIRHECQNGSWQKYTRDEYGNTIFWEDDMGNWEETSYDENGNLIYWKNDDGDWEKHSYNEKGEFIYWENGNGEWGKYEYNEEGYLTYCEESSGYVNYYSYTYDEYGNVIYREGTDGSWQKYIVMEI